MTHDDKKSKALIEMPFVTITIPAYNEQESLPWTVQSVLDLDYPKEKYELLIVDDGSTDKTAHIAQEIMTKNPSYHIRLISQKNQGKGGALNNALHQAQGTYFVCLDADSFVAPDALTKMLPHFADIRVAAVLPALKIHNPQNKLEKLQWYEYIINMFYKEPEKLFQMMGVDWKKREERKIVREEPKGVPIQVEVSKEPVKNEGKRTSLLELLGLKMVRERH
jgi:cellulose synthase/poly-beta-1,6-N-acetylglucosamine synthase-like glycosyltransferase